MVRLPARERKKRKREWGKGEERRYLCMYQVMKSQSYEASANDSKDKRASPQVLLHGRRAE